MRGSAIFWKSVYIFLLPNVDPHERRDKRRYMEGFVGRFLFLLELGQLSNSS